MKRVGLEVLARRRWSFKGREDVGAWSAMRTRRGFGREEESIVL